MKSKLPTSEEQPTHKEEVQLPGSLDQIGFEDDFSPFISSASSRSAPEDYAVFADRAEKDPTEELSALFGSLSAFREQAQSMPDNDRKDFAADVALRFARQLDALMGTSDDDVADDLADLSVSNNRKA